METTISSALKALKMPGMAESWRVMEETHQLDKLSVREAMPLLLQAEMDNRETNRISKLIKGAGFRLTATIEELDINAARGVPADVITQLGTGEYIKMGGTIIEFNEGLKINPNKGEYHLSAELQARVRLILQMHLATRPADRVTRYLTSLCNVSPTK